MIIISWNINGLKNRFSEVKKLAEIYEPDFICLQKVRCNNGREQFQIDGYQALYSSVDSGNWSGVITYARIPDENSPNVRTFVMPQRINTPALSDQGHLQVFRCKNFALVNAYVPFANDKIKGAREYRSEWDYNFRQYILELSKETHVVICGDFNVVHTIKDTCESHLEQNRPCFSKWERDSFNLLLEEANLADAFREKNPDEITPTYYGYDRSSNAGNRIDYFIISRALLSGVVSSGILSQFDSGQSIPIILDFDPDIKNEPTLNVRLDQYSDQNRYTCNSNTLSIREAARWLAAIAASDGVVSPSERKLLKEFADAYDIAPDSLIRMAYAIAGQIDIPEVEFRNQSEVKGRKFEEFIVRLTADDTRFKLLNWSSDKYIDGIYSLDTLMPDLHIRHRLDAGVVEYYVECKYRSSLPDGILDLTSQLGRYRRMASAKNNSELFIAVGIGGTPSAPEKLYIIPSRMIKKDYVIHIENFSGCLCSNTTDGFHNYISHYYNKRVFKTI